MANHQSAMKRIRSSETKRVLNRYVHKTTRNAMKKLRLTSKKKEAEKLLIEVTSMLDKLAKRNVIHKNKAGNLVGKLTRHVNALSK
jgi:small subunit ribosomal protein S20